MFPLWDFITQTQTETRRMLTLTTSVCEHVKHATQEES